MFSTFRIKCGIQIVLYLFLENHLTKEHTHNGGENDSLKVYFYWSQILVSNFVQNASKAEDF